MQIQYRYNMLLSEFAVKTISDQKRADERRMERNRPASCQKESTLESTRPLFSYICYTIYIMLSNGSEKSPLPFGQGKIALISK